jgi:hypothetical protein
MVIASNPTRSIDVREMPRGDSLENFFARLAGIRMMVLAGLQGESATSDTQFLFSRLLYDVACVVGETKELVALRARLPKLAGLRDPDRRLNIASELVDHCAAILIRANGNGSGRAGTELEAFRSDQGDLRLRSWIAIGFFLAALIGARVAYVPIVLDKLVFPYHRQRLDDLATLKGAFEKFRASSSSFPRSANGGRDWSGVGWDGDSATWLPELVPTYLLRLPVDPRRNNNRYNQYIYKSNGVDYKLLALAPEDCVLTINEQPSMSDPARNVHNQCYAYGYWTPGAMGW